MAEHNKKYSGSVETKRNREKSIKTTDTNKYRPNKK